jgi:PHD/YefM family antitoxin component YafN of YafNO toxin-antitoxin module
MTTLTIPKKVTRGDELVVMSRKEYERLISSRIIPEYEATPREKRELARARRDMAAGKFMTIDELKKKLGFTS